MSGRGGWSCVLGVCVFVGLFDVGWRGWVGCCGLVGVGRSGFVDVCLWVCWCVCVSADVFVCMFADVVLCGFVGVFCLRVY